MKIGILGGSFDPIHFGHVEIAKIAKKKMALDQIWIVPTLRNPLKNGASKSFEERFVACQKEVENLPGFFVKDYKNHSVSTFELVKKIRAQNCRDEFFWIMGEDNLEKFHLWKNCDKLIKSIAFVVFARGGAVSFSKNRKIFRDYQKLSKSGKNLPNFTFLNAKKIAISSSEIRQKYYC